MVVSHINNVQLGTNSIDVNCDTDGAKVSISQDNMFLGFGIVNGGSVSINFPALTSNQPLIVTGTKQNFMPYQGVISVADGPTSINEIILDGVNVFPNPASSELNLAWKNTTPTSIELRDLSGKVVYSNTIIAESKLTIKTTDFASGVYILKVRANNKLKVTKVTLN